MILVGWSSDVSQQTRQLCSLWSLSNLAIHQMNFQLGIGSRTVWTCDRFLIWLEYGVGSTQHPAILWKQRRSANFILFFVQACSHRCISTKDYCKYRIANFIESNLVVPESLPYDQINQSKIFGWSSEKMAFGHGTLGQLCCGFAVHVPPPSKG